MHSAISVPTKKALNQRGFGAESGTDAANFCRGRQKFAGEGIFQINSVEAQHTAHAMDQFFIRLLFINYYVYYVRKSA